jgi:hypothetical protein
MTTATRWVKHAARVAAGVTLALTTVSAQAPAAPQADGQTPPRQAARGGQRTPAVPGGELNMQTVQNLVDAWALVEAEKDLGLTDTQYPDFVTRMQRVQSTRRRQMMERQRMLRELNAMAFGAQPADDGALTEKLKALDQLNEKSAQEMRQLTGELDSILTPRQRVRFRIFEDRMERRKIDMLMRARAGRGGQ